MEKKSRTYKDDTVILIQIAPTVELNAEVGPKRLFSMWEDDEVDVKDY